ncbi:hypothetical protein [Neisseria dumasiana]|uniref:NTP pyrophosphohydrolase MazG putative catalytic core domain-containing protein n=1 Tax=Neisseria dumasiana TaxID=1931275 RepID=A0ABX3WJN7_9NEIS|nr:hypothetical protein [Neisseria dumasiana]OSI25805.1 hypothetical protein BV913_12200 [Neisseria dumasiana]OSI26469.1 hypothetical protein BV913_12105 [Neisseria dumasiana]UOO84354.1 hypothetical protein LVJ88_12000 [Neisseria dumasiana]
MTLPVNGKKLWYVCGTVYGFGEDGLADLNKEIRAVSRIFEYEMGDNYVDIFYYIFALFSKQFNQETEELVIQELSMLSRIRNSSDVLNTEASDNQNDCEIIHQYIRCY